ncbi:MAG TPA: DUF2269 family protein [Anaerolineales bacterium]|jgi:uncharacterized membrane protein
MLYLALKVLHILAVVLFLGNIITGLFWKAHADRSSNPEVIAHTFEGIIRSDRLITIPSVIAIGVAGVIAAIIGKLPILGTGWIFWSIVLFAVSGLVFSMRVAPLQAKLAELSRADGPKGKFNWARYHALSREWELWGLFAILTPLAAVVLMVFKPAIPGL